MVVTEREKEEKNLRVTHGSDCEENADVDNKLAEVDSEVDRRPLVTLWRSTPGRSRKRCFDHVRVC